MSYVPRIRKSGSRTVVGFFGNYQFGIPSHDAQPLDDVRYEALLVSEGHSRTRNGAWSGGGPFYCFKRTISHGSTMTRFVRTGGGWNENGTSVCRGVDGFPYTDPSIEPPSWDTVREDASQHYATGYARARPGNPEASLGQFLIELRDLPQIPFIGAWKVLRSTPIWDLPKVLYRRLQGFLTGSNNVGSEYLNLQFGWLPFVSDVRKMYHLWHTIDKRLAQIVRENGKYIRRKATVLSDVSVSTEESVSDPFVSVRGVYPVNLSGEPKQTDKTVTRTTTKVWFSGSFRYYIPDVGSSQWDRRARLALFGALPTPELLWNVLPWSWLIDWFSNLGDVISNASPNAVDNLTTRYSFIMKHVEVRRERSIHVTHGPRYGWDQLLAPALDHTFSSCDLVERKVRVGGGNPFGLNVQLSSLSDYQLSILAALGISRGKVH